MAWIESHTVLIRHRKVLFAAIDLKIKPVQMIGHLHALWHTALEQQEDGNLTEWPDQMIADAAAWEEDASQFVGVLHQRGWLDNRILHDWIDYVGDFLTKKYHSSNRQKLVNIWKVHGCKYGKGKGKYGKIQVSKKEVTSQSEVRLPNQPNQPNQPKKNSRALSDDEFLERLRKSPAYQGLDVDAQLAAMDNWLLAHPNRKKSRQFIVNWLNRQEKPLPRASPLDGLVCQERVQRGLHLKPCGEKAVAQIGKRPVCQFHQEEHDAKRSHANTPVGSPDGTSGTRSGAVGAAV